MRDTRRCVQALILKALKIQWGHIYLHVAAAKDALQPNNNIPVNWNRLDMPQHTAGWTQWSNIYWTGIFFFLH